MKVTPRKAAAKAPTGNEKNGEDKANRRERLIDHLVRDDIINLDRFVREFLIRQILTPPPPPAGARRGRRVTPLNKMADDLQTLKAKLKKKKNSPSSPPRPRHNLLPP